MSAIITLTTDFGTRDGYVGAMEGVIASRAPEAPVSVAGQIIAMARTYGEVAPDALLAYIGSMNTVEIAVRDGRADQRLGVPRGAAIRPAKPTAGPYR